MSMTFVSLVLLEFVKAYNFRSDRHSIFRRPFANKWLNLAILWEVVLLVFILSFEPLHEAFGTSPLSRTDWLMAGVPALSLTPVLELTKWIVSRRPHSSP
jgi:Ca2+-transporting ATPase